MGLHRANLKYECLIFLCFSGDLEWTRRSLKCHRLSRIRHASERHVSINHGMDCNFDSKTAPPVANGSIIC